MRKKERRTTILFLTLCMMLSALPPGTRAAEPERLPTPAELVWGKMYNAYIVELPGAMSWSTGGEIDLGHYRTFLYCKESGEKVRSSGWNGKHESGKYCDNGISYWQGRDFEGDLPDGTYFFTVQAIGDGVNYLDSEISAPSEDFVYKRPDKKVPGISKLAWSGAKTELTPPSDLSNICGYDVMGYFSETIDGEKTEIGGMTSYDLTDFWYAIVEEYLSDWGRGYYWVKARTLSKDINEYQNSDWLLLSEPYYLETAITPEKTPIAKGMFTVDTTPETYDGTAKTKTITSNLTQGTDYMVSYSDNVNVGTATITITGKGNYSGTLIYTFEIANKEALLFSVVRNSITLIDGNSATPKITLNPQGAEVIWNSSSPAVVTVTSDGAITGVGEGKAVITGTASYNGQKKTASYTVTVKPRVGITLVNSEMVASGLNSLYKLNFGYSPLDATITVSTSNPSVADVTYSVQTGAYIIPKGSGSAVVTVTVEKDGKGKSASCTVTVPSSESEVSNNYVEYVKRFDNKSYTEVNEMLKTPMKASATSWCANFVSQAAADIGLGEIIPLNKSCSYLYSAMLNSKGTVISGSLQSGDIVFFKWKTDCPACSSGCKQAANSDTFNHVGVITLVNENIITVTHGNYNKKTITRNGKQITEKRVTTNTWDTSKHTCLASYVRPNWANTQAKSGKITIKFNCPIDVRYTYGDEVLDNATGQLNATFGTMVVNDEDESITVTLNDYYYDVNAEITGNGEGVMDLIATFEDKDGITSTRSFQNVPISTKTLGKLYSTDSVSTAYLELYENDGENFVEVWTAGVDETSTGKDESLTAWYTSDNDYGDAVVSPTPSSSSGNVGSLSVAYAVTAPAVSNGKVYLSHNIAKKGATVTVTVTPDKGYKLDTLTVTDSKGKTMELTDLSEEKYTFTMPNSKVEVTASFVEEPPRETSPTPDPVYQHFTDINSTDWFVEAAQYACDNGMMNGMAENVFAPQVPVSRAMMVTVLYRLEGEPSVTSASFSDVAEGNYYANAVAWGSANGLVNGFEDKTFRPDRDMTREQLATLLYRYAAMKGLDVTQTTDLSGYIDLNQISLYALPAMKWVNAAGLLTGTDWGGLAPQTETTRAEAAAILMRFCKGITE